MDERRDRTNAPPEPEQVGPNEPLPGPPDGVDIEPAQPHEPSGETAHDAARIHDHNRRLARGDEAPSEESERAHGVGRTVTSDPESGVTRGDYSND
ncbi:MAG TPA: hypothetical protein VNM91_02230 [Dehalococcoidia bacterium]|nr:hypothetical protein [Dehalococcoidia bacterium]